jgi:hypothetical protein
MADTKRRRKTPHDSEAGRTKKSRGEAAANQEPERAEAKPERTSRKSGGEAGANLKEERRRSRSEPAGRAEAKPERTRKSGGEAGANLTGARSERAAYTLKSSAKGPI